jgi:hypothetical protein
MMKVSNIIYYDFLRTSGGPDLRRSGCPNLRRNVRIRLLCDFLSCNIFLKMLFVRIAGVGITAHAAHIGTSRCAQHVGDVSFHTKTIRFSRIFITVTFLRNIPLVNIYERHESHRILRTSGRPDVRRKCLYAAW